MARTYVLRGVTDEKGRLIAQAWCQAWNSTDQANLVLVETQYTDASGNATFVALPDTAPVDVSITFAGQIQWRRNVYNSAGYEIDDAADKAHTQNTDEYADGIRTGTSFPVSPSDGELFYRTDLGKLYQYVA